MKKYPGFLMLFFALSAMLLSSCEAIAGIFKAGVWTGVLLIVGIVALVIFLFSKIAGKK